MTSRVGGPDFQPWTLFSLLEPPFLHSLRLSCVFGNLGNEAILITDADEVFALGSNGAGCLGLGDMSSTLEPKKVEALSGKVHQSESEQSPTKKRLHLRRLVLQGIVHLAYGSGPHVVASTKSGEVFTWGHNGYCQLGNGSTSQCYTPTQLEGTLQNKVVTEVACGSHHSVCLTKDGDIYAWGQNNCGQIGTGTTTNQSTPRKVSSPFAGKKVTSISCGQTSTMVALESGEVYGWGYNGNGQLGLGNNINQLSPSRVASVQGCVVKVVCGYAHTLALSDEGELYGWGANSYGQLGTGTKANSCIPTRVAEDIGRVIDIAASHYNHISAAITQDSTVYMWGQCHGQSVVLPTPTSFVRLQDVFACFATPAVTPVPMVTEISSVPNIIDSLKLAFDDASTADVRFVVEGREINVHRAILKIRCEHFRSMFQVRKRRESEKSVGPSI